MVGGLRGLFQVFNFGLEILEMFFLSFAEGSLRGTILRLAFLRNFRSVNASACSLTRWTYRSGFRSQRLPTRLFGSLVLAFSSFPSALVVVVFSVHAFSLIVQITRNVANHAAFIVKVVTFITKIGLWVKVEERTVIAEVEVPGARSARHVGSETEGLGGKILLVVKDRIWIGRLIGAQRGQEQFLLITGEEQAFC